MTLEEAMVINPHFIPEPGVSYSSDQCELIARCRDPHTKRFSKGYSEMPGRKKGSRNRLTQEMLDRIANGTPPDVVLIDIYQDPNAAPDLRYKAAAKVADLVYPKAASVEVVIDEKDKFTKEQIEDRIKQLAGAGVFTPKEGE